MTDTPTHRPLTEQEKRLISGPATRMIPREKLAAWGIPWPPPRGWRTRLKNEGVPIAPVNSAPTSAPSNMMIGDLDQPQGAPTTRTSDRPFDRNERGPRRR